MPGTVNNREFIDDPVGFSTTVIIEIIDCIFSEEYTIYVEIEHPRINPTIETTRVYTRVNGH